MFRGNGWLRGRRLLGDVELVLLGERRMEDVCCRWCARRTSDDDDALVLAVPGAQSKGEALTAQSRLGVPVSLADHLGQLVCITRVI